MEIKIDGSNFEYRTNYQDDAKLRGSFDALAQQTFDLSFESWYRDGNWSDRYRPYSLIYGGEVVANVSVSPMDFTRMGQGLQCVQLGTVMTAPAFRNRGLIHFLMARVLADWGTKCDAVFLYANDSTLTFYPKFGFAAAREYRHTLPIQADGARHITRTLIAGVSTDRNLLLTKYALSNPFSLFSLEHNPGLLLYYCSGPMRQSVYYVDEYGAAAVAEYDGETLYLHDVFCGPDVPLKDLLTALARPETTKAVLGFTPRDGAACSVRPLREPDATLMVLGGKEDLFQGRQLRLPLLSRT